MTYFCTTLEFGEYSNVTMSVVEIGAVARDPGARNARTFVDNR